jgi:hypothetical protein
MFKFLKRKMTRKYEEKIEQMSDYLDAWIATYQHELNFNKGLLENENESVQRKASGEIEKDTGALLALYRLRDEYDKIIESE